MAVTICTTRAARNRGQRSNCCAATGSSRGSSEYLKQPPAAAEIRRVLGLLKLEPRQLMRRREPAYTALRLDEPELTPARLVAAMAANPALIERPVVIAGRKAAIGRPPEAVLEVL